jgi:FkbM family methyltransferase
MNIANAQKFFRRIRRKLQRNPDRFLRSVSGVIHVGANTGQEREKYDRYRLDVLWIEPIPNVFKELQENIANFSRQKAIQGLVTDQDNETCNFFLANNNGASSSIFELCDHVSIWPDIEYTETLQLQSKTLPTLLAEQGVDASAFDALIMDTQGSELLVLKGAEDLIEQFSFVKTEVADFEAYAGCCRLTDLNAFMRGHGFKIMSKRAFASKKSVGTYFDVTYQRSK